MSRLRVALWSTTCTAALIALAWQMGLLLDAWKACEVEVCMRDFHPAWVPPFGCVCVGYPLKPFTEKYETPGEGF